MLVVSSILARIISKSFILIGWLSNAILLSSDIKITNSGASALELVFDLGGFTSNKSVLANVPESMKKIKSKNTIFIKGTKFGSLFLLVFL